MTQQRTVRVGRILEVDVRGLRNRGGVRRLLVVVAITLIAGHALLSSDASTSAHSLPDADRSERFWNRLTAFGDYGLVYDSIAEMGREAHVIVSGRIIDFTHSEFYPFDPRPAEPDDPRSWPILVAVVEVEAVLKGTPQMRTANRIEVALDVSPADEGYLRDHLPLHPHLFFLMHDARQRTELGYPLSDPDNERYRYWRPNGYQAVLRVISGRVAVIKPRAEWEQPYADMFPIELDGSPLENVLSALSPIEGVTVP
jgi:hypothetical protein